MEYFEIFELKPSFHPDHLVVKKKYYELSRTFHPDFHASAELEEREAVLQKSALLNRAYKTLIHPDAVMGYILEQKGMLEQEKQPALPPEFLMEMMEINEALGEADPFENPEVLDTVTEQIHGLEKEMYADVEKDLEADPTDPASEKALLRIKDYYLKKKYLQRILERIAGMRNIAPR